MPRRQPRPTLLVGDLPHGAILAARRPTAPPGAAPARCWSDVRDQQLALAARAGRPRDRGARLQPAPGRRQRRPVLGEVSDGLGMSTAETGVLTSLPVLAFAVFGALAPRLARAGRPAPAHARGAACVVGGLAGRAAVSSVPVFLRALAARARRDGHGQRAAALAGQAALPRPDRPDDLDLLHGAGDRADLGLRAHRARSARRTTAGARACWSGRSPPASPHSPGWPWSRHDRRPEEVEGRVGLLDVARTRLGWLMALFFGLQSLQAYSIFGWFAELYHDAGFSAHTAGLLLGVITGVSIPLSFLIPWLVARTHDQRAADVRGDGLLPARLPRPDLRAARRRAWPWALLVGAGTATFPLILTLIGLRARTPAGTAALSGFTQSTGYLIAGDRPVRRRPAARPVGRLDGAADRPAGAHGPAAAARAGGRRARRTSRTSWHRRRRGRRSGRRRPSLEDSSSPARPVMPLSAGSGDAPGPAGPCSPKSASLPDVQLVLCRLDRHGLLIERTVTMCPVADRRDPAVEQLSDVDLAVGVTARLVAPREAPGHPDHGAARGDLVDRTTRTRALPSSGPPGSSETQRLPRRSRSTSVGTGSKP